MVKASLVGIVLIEFWISEFIRNSYNISIDDLRTMCMYLLVHTGYDLLILKFSLPIS